jgi:hypothetical protein
MAARSKVIVANDESFKDRNFAALDEEDESTAEELHALIERKKGDFISLDEYLKLRGIE